MSAPVRMRLGLAICVEGNDAHGYRNRRNADGVGGRRHAWHNGVVTAWRQVLVEAGCEIPNMNWQHPRASPTAQFIAA